MGIPKNKVNIFFIYIVYSLLSMLSSSDLSSFDLRIKFSYSTYVVNPLYLSSRLSVDGNFESIILLSEIAADFACTKHPI